jgi:hypothetical protein
MDRCYRLITTNQRPCSHSNLKAPESGHRRWQLDEGQDDDRYLTLISAADPPKSPRKPVHVLTPNIEEPL